jgi:hypothetical protein
MYLGAIAGLSKGRVVVHTDADVVRGAKLGVELVEVGLVACLSRKI